MSINLVYDLETWCTNIQKVWMAVTTFSACPSQSLNPFHATHTFVLVAAFTNRGDHVTDEKTPGSKGPVRIHKRLLRIVSSSCVARGRFQVFLECRSPRLQLASSSFLPRTRRCEQGKVPDQLTLRTSRCVAKPAKFFSG